jgi:hypothetical protein
MRVRTQVRPLRGRDCSDRSQANALLADPSLNQGTIRSMRRATYSLSLQCVHERSANPLALTPPPGYPRHHPEACWTQTLQACEYFFGVVGVSTPASRDLVKFLAGCWGIDEKPGEVGHLCMLRFAGIFTERFVGGAEGKAVEVRAKWLDKRRGS